MIISTCNHKHIDGYDTMYPCSEFEMILIRFPRRYFSKLKYRKKHTKMQKIITCNHLHIDRYDTKNQCRKFEEILMRT